MTVKTDEYSAGDFRSVVTVQRCTETPDGSGGQSTAWADVATLFCLAVCKREGEEYGDGSTGRIKSVEVISFTTWWQDSFTVKDRVSFEGRLFNIREIENLKRRNKFMKIVAEAGVEQ